MITYRAPWILRPGQEETAFKLECEWLDRHWPKGSGSVVRIYRPDLAPDLFIFENSWPSQEAHDAAWVEIGKHATVPPTDIVIRMLANQTWHVAEWRYGKDIPPEGALAWQTTWLPKPGKDREALEYALRWQNAFAEGEIPKGLLCTRWYAPQHSPNVLIFEGIWQSAEENDAFWATFPSEPEDVAMFAGWHQLNERRISCYRYRVFEWRFGL